MITSNVPSAGDLDPLRKEILDLPLVAVGMDREAFRAHVSKVIEARRMQQEEQKEETVV